MGQPVGLFSGTKWESPSECAVCGKPATGCECPSDLPSGDVDAPRWLAPEKQSARVRVEKRKAKRVVTVVAGLSPEATDLPALLSQLKSACGAGGALEDDNLVIQGDQASRVQETLKRIGYRIANR
jgi:translation initiation factor 1